VITFPALKISDVKTVNRAIPVIA